MPRNMSFSITTKQFINRTKTVTRRMGWKNLSPGDIVNGVEKAMGLKKGEKIKILSKIEIVSNTEEPLNSITYSDVVKEGFPELTPIQFIEMFCDTHKRCTPNTIISRIEFKYL